MPLGGTLRFLRQSVRLVLSLASIAFVGTGVPAFAQHGGGHAGGGGGHVSAPHVSTPHVASPGTAAPPIHVSVTNGAGRTFVATPPPVRLAMPPAGNRPIVGNHVMMPPVLPPVSGPRTVIVGPHSTVGFPRTGMLDGR